MTAYVVIIRQKTLDRSGLAKYVELASQAPADDAQLLAMNSEFEVLEGPPAEGVLILTFPDMSSARRWYRSEKYQAAVVHRLKAADYLTVLVEGGVHADS